MDRLATHSLTALAVLVFAITSIGTIFSAPPAQAQTVTFATELA